MITNLIYVHVPSKSTKRHCSRSWHCDFFRQKAEMNSLTTLSLCLWSICFVVWFFNFALLSSECGKLDGMSNKWSYFTYSVMIILNFFLPIGFAGFPLRMWRRWLYAILTIYTVVMLTATIYLASSGEIPESIPVPSGFTTVKLFRFFNLKNSSDTNLAFWISLGLYLAFLVNFSIMACTSFMFGPELLLHLFFSFCQVEIQRVRGLSPPADFEAATRNFV